MASPWEMNWETSQPASGAAPWEMPWSGSSQEFGPAHPADHMRSLVTDFLNQGSAAGQGTTPNIAAHMPQLLSTDLHQNDAGEILYRDPSTGQLIPTDQNKHVVLRDPSDSRLKMFARSEGTDEGALSSAGRLLMTGMASGAPSRLAGGPGMAMKPQARGPAPSIDQLFTRADELYKSPEVAALEIKPQSVKDFGGSVRDGLFNVAKVDENLAPVTYGIVDKLAKMPTPQAGERAFATADNLDTFRKMLGNAAGKDGAESKAASYAIRRIDEYLASIRPADTLAGDAGAASSALTEARGNWSAAEHALNIDRRIAAAQQRASASNSGMNAPNTIRQRIADIIDPRFPERQRGFSPEALAKMEEIVHGTKTQNLIRGTGNVLGGGGGWPMVVTGVLSGGVAPAVGFGLKLFEGVLAGRQIDKLSELIRSQSPLGRQMQPPISAWGKAAQTFGANPTPRAFAQVSLASRNLANNLKDAGIAVTPADLMRSLQGPVRAPADDEQP